MRTRVGDSCDNERGTLMSVVREVPLKRGRFSPFFLVAPALIGCASPGLRVDEQPRAPVYRFGQETPCDYESIGPITAETTLYSGDDYEKTRVKALGEAAARMGADAVILPDPAPSVRLPFVVQGQLSPPRQVRFEGEAVRWVAGTCRR
jgi:hypothetical protein